MHCLLNVFVFSVHKCLFNVCPLKDFERSRAFSFLSEVKKRFQTTYGSRAQTALPYAMNSEFSSTLAAQMVSMIRYWRILSCDGCVALLWLYSQLCSRKEQECAFSSFRIITKFGIRLHHTHKQECLRITVQHVLQDVFQIISPDQEALNAPHVIGGKRM